jgi:hypothetical protein
MVPYLQSLVVHDCNPSHLAEGGRKVTSSRPALAKLARLYLRNKMQIKGLGA